MNCGGGLLRCLERQASLPESDRLSPLDRQALLDAIYDVWVFGGGNPAWCEPAVLDEAAVDPGGEYGWDWEDEEEPAVGLAEERAPWQGAAAASDFDVAARIAGALTDAERDEMEDRLRKLIAKPIRPYTSDVHRKREAVSFLFKLRRVAGVTDAELLEEYKRAELWDDATALLLQMGRIDEAVALAGRQLTTPQEALAFANRLIALGNEHVARALQLIDARLWETEGTKPHEDLMYLDWLSARYAEHGMAKEAFETDLRRFKRRPDFAHYKAVQAATTRPGLEADLWERTRPRLLAELSDARQWGTLIDVYLDAGQVGEAIAALQAWERGQARPSAAPTFGVYGYGWLGIAGYRERVAKAAERDHPDEAVRLYRALADAAIAGRNRQAYATAATYLVAVRRILEETGRAAEWQQLITALREEHKRLRALKEELDALGLN
jgi:hypothetical protein